MQISPRYDGPPVLVVDLPFGDPTVPLLRQRHRLAEVLGTFDSGQWAAPSRCAEWSTQDVIAHLVGTNQFWAMSISSARSGAPTRFLENFDPVATPAQMVSADRGIDASEVLARLVDSTDALEQAVRGVGNEDWATILAEAPPGHIALGAVVLHALWDGWIHERDILLPLGLPVTEEPDEVAGCLRYAAALSPAFGATTGSTREGTLVVEATDPELRFVVEVGTSVRVHDGAATERAARLQGRSVDLVEGLSLRAPLGAPVAEEHAWMLAGLTTVFDQSD